ncbi:CD209 antigen-like isoform X2 [Dicentrarchus labrax]|uniref:CD209 antigen-like isoform X2 n=1 Tax=Dicentrarchus labrax TaxID=13489 RepID=UPI0021F56BD4|nr:CD209 antigen-like isoform X2 [Dicentrarchus labrax]
MQTKGFYCVLFQLWLLQSRAVASSLVNVAPSGTATQSSTASGGYPYKAIDGNRDPVYSHGSCSHTSGGLSSWWSLLLPGLYKVARISITNRYEIPERINNAKILIGNSLENNGNNNPSCAVISSIPGGATSTFQCGGMIGRLVNVYLYHTNPEVVLTLCELEVYGELLPPAPTFSAVVMGRNVAVVERRLCWSDALLYCRDFHWDLLSIRSAEEQMEVEAALTTASFNLTRHVWLGLRRYLMGDTWFWMSGAPMSYNYLDRKLWQESSPCGGIDTGAPFHWRDIPCGDHLHFICLKDIQSETRGVEFFSSTRMKSP